MNSAKYSDRMGPIVNHLAWCAAALCQSQTVIPSDRAGWRNDDTSSLPENASCNRLCSLLRDPYKAHICLSILRHQTILEMKHVSSGSPSHSYSSRRPRSFHGWPEAAVRYLLPGRRRALQPPAIDRPQATLYGRPQARGRQLGPAQTNYRAYVLMLGGCGVYMALVYRVT